jgi:hypothetical protein
LLPALPFIASLACTCAGGSSPSAPACPFPAVISHFVIEIGEAPSMTTAIDDPPGATPSAAVTLTSKKLDPPAPAAM